ncbi:hypothetical protein ACEPAI_95 [Sanghuangporus weigelae]
MLLSDLIFKFSSFLAGLTVVHDPSDPAILKQSPIAMDSASESGPAMSLMLSDVLTVHTSASIFFSYARETQVGELFKAGDARVTVFAPTNKAVMALSRKPHQGPIPVDDAVISEEEFDARSKENVQRWISAHIVPQVLPSLSPSSKYETLLDGVAVTVSSKSESPGSDKSDWQRVVLNENIFIVDRAEAANGVLYLLDGALYG